MDPFEENIEGLYQSADTEGRGYITRDEFIAVCCSTFIGTSVNTHARTHTQKHTHTQLFKLEQLALLTEEDHSRMTQCYDQVAPDGRAKYTEFYGLGKELILCLYRNQDTSDVRVLCVCIGIMGQCTSAILRNDTKKFNLMCVEKL